MNKQARLLLALVLALCLAGCGQKKASTAELEAQIAELQAQLDQQNSQNSSENKTDTDETTDAITEPAEPEEISAEEVSAEEDEKAIEAQSIRLNETVSTDFVEFTFDKISTAQELKPENPKSYYTYLADQDNETFMYMKGTIKNVGTSKFEVANSSFCKIVVDDKYEYLASVNLDESGSFSYIYSYLDPFQSAPIYISASVPDELINQYSSMKVYFGFNENFENDYSSNIENCDYLYSVTAAK